MTNLEKWRFYNKHIWTPDSWINLAWCFIVNSCLERRVWAGAMDDRPLFPNIYLVPIGPPATGKGLIIGPTVELLRHWKRNPAEQDMDDPINLQLRRLFNVGADTTTFEKLVEDLADCTTNFTFQEEGRQRSYVHASLAFCLEELNSFFRRHNDQIPKLMNNAFDCKDYSYRTKHNQTFTIRKICMNLMAGTTISTLREAAKYSIFEDGFTSRTIFAFESRPRFETFFLEEPDDDQRQALQDLRLWVRHLAGVYGKVRYPSEVRDFIEDWFRRVHIPTRDRAGPKMQVYYGRKRVHLQKIAFAMHFSESLDMTITLQDFQRAIDLLAAVEANMALGFNTVGRNELNPATQQIITYIATAGQVSFVELLARFMSEVTAEELKTILDTLLLAGEIHHHPTTGKYIKYGEANEHRILQ